MRSWGIGAGLVALLIADPAAALTVDELPAGSVYTVRAVRIEGVSFLTARSLRAAMLTQRPPWYQPWKRWRKKTVFNPQLFRTDLDRVRTALRESGHYEASVTHELELDGEAITIVLHVDEGSVARVSVVNLITTDFTLSPDEEAPLRRELTLQANAPFTQAQYDDSRARLEAYYQERGYAYASVDKAATVDAAAHEATVTYTIRRSIPAVFGATTVNGTQTIDPVLITRELQYRPGDPYDPRKVEKTQASVFGLHLFRSVAVKPANLEAESGVVDIAIIVSEGPPREVKIGVGYGLEDGPRGEVRWQHYDFLGGGRQLGFRLKGSLITQAVEGEFRQPYFLHPQQSLVVPLTQEREEEPGFTVQRIRLAPRIERRFLPELRAALGYNIEYDDTTNVPDETNNKDIAKSTMARLRAIPPCRKAVSLGPLNPPAPSALTASDRDDKSGMKPFILTEYGPNGIWETGRNTTGAYPEPTSTEKADAYRRAYRGCRPASDRSPFPTSGC